MGGPEMLSPFGSERWQPSEVLHTNHFYASYVFDQAQERQAAAAGVISEAQRLGYPVRYWWLSDAMDLRDNPDRLIVCVHHPATSENAGMDLYTALQARRITWDALDAATMEEYATLSKPLTDPSDVQRPDGL